MFMIESEMATTTMRCFASAWTVFVNEPRTSGVVVQQGLAPVGTNREEQRHVTRTDCSMA